MGIGSINELEALAMLIGVWEVTSSHLFQLLVEGDFTCGIIWAKDSWVAPRWVQNYVDNEKRKKERGSTGIRI